MQIKLSERERLLLHSLVYDSRINKISLAKACAANSTVRKAILEEAKELEDLERKLKEN